jgi:hypothetical protein
MRRRLLALALCLLGLPALAGERKLNGAEIHQTLSSHTLKGSSDSGDWSQDFDPSGRTTYSQGNNNSPGRWEVRDDQYCSVWPPNPSWSCYDVTVDGDVITFVTKSGGRSSGTIAK